MYLRTKTLQMKKIPKHIITAVLFLCFYAAYRGPLSHIIAYHEQHQLFLFTKAYFEHQVHSEGFFSYLTNFLIQFFYFPLFGSAILAALIASTFLLTHALFRKIIGEEDWLCLSIFPSLALFFHTMEASHTLIPVIVSVTGLIIANIILWFFRRNLPLLSFFRKMSVRNIKLRTALTAAALLLYAGLGFSHFVKKYNRHEGITLKAAMYVQERNWEKVLEYTELYLNNGMTNQLIAYFHNLALFHTNQLFYRLFEHPQQLGAQSLYFPWRGNARDTEYGHIVYECLGHINEAQHWESEAMVVWGETAPHLLNLAQYSIVNHQPEKAQRFINKLKHSLFYRKEALRMETIKNSGEVEGLRNALSGIVETPARFTDFLNIGTELNYLCSQDPMNRMAFEYYMCYLLLNNNLAVFAENLHRMSAFNYPIFPPAFEEALLLYKLDVGEEAFAKAGFAVSQTTETKYKRYTQLLQQKRTKELQREFGKTYWFYLSHIDPFRKGSNFKH